MQPSGVFILVFCLLFPAPSAGSEDLIALGISSLKTGKYLDALSAFNKTLENEPDNARAYNGRGTVWFELSAYKRAIADYSQAVRINPDYANAYNNRGVVYFRKGGYEQAIQDYNRALSISSDYANALSNRGAALIKTGEYVRALADFNKALTLEPSFETYNLLAWTLATCPDDNLRNGSGAVEAAEKAVAIKSDTRSLGTLAAAYAEAGVFASAIDTELRVIDMLKNDGSINEMEAHNARLARYRSGQPYRDILAAGSGDKQKATTVAGDPEKKSPPPHD